MRGGGGGGKAATRQGGKSWLWLVAIYVVLIAVSKVIRGLHPLEEPLDPGERVQTVRTVDGDRLTNAPVRMAYLDHPADRGPEAPTVVLIHGSPGDNGEVSRVAMALAPRFRVIAPDLPGFGASTANVPDYSFRAHARYVLELLDSLRTGPVHLVGFSMGGGVVLSMADLAPDRVASLTLLSAIGAQEFELLGDYYLNHAVHAAQLAGIWLLEEAIPHFGAFDGGLTYAYARNFYDSDQRPLRRILNRFEGPVLIVQGDNDPLVQPGIAAEHHRLAPQSELVMLNGDHFMAFQRPAELAVPIGDFIDRAARGAATTRRTADPARIAAAALSFDPRSIPAPTGIALAVLLAFLATATLVSEDLACIATGLLVGRGSVSLAAGTLACLIGIFVGDILLFMVGRVFGRAAIRHPPLRWLVSESDVERTSVWFAGRGPWLILGTRFVPGTRLPTYLTAGILHTRFFAFAGMFLVAAVLWTPLLVGASALFGGQVLALFDSYRRLALPALLGSAFLLLLAVKLVVPLFSWRGRRLLLGRWRRLTRWEFWPRWAFYPPIVLHVLWLGLRYRSLTLFSAANPAMPGGGFVGESKWQILRGLGRQGLGVARTALLAGEEPVESRVASLHAFRLRERLEYPIVLKPDVGERGSGVAIVRTEAEAQRYLSAATGDVLAQEYVPGLEIGVFYYRLPGEAEGRIFAITDKRFPSVRGDGRHSLEHLILAHERAVAMAPFFLARHSAHLLDVPPDGDIVPLVELGTHCRGAAFFEGEWLRTAELERAIDELSRRYEGFWFGRYDIRAASYDDLRAGRDFTVIELNGATSEATSIYDPKNGLFEAYRILRRQWAILFEIGDRNRSAGVRPATLGEMLGLFRKHRREVEVHVEG